MRQQAIAKKEQTPVGETQIDDRPVRTILYIEVGDMDQNEISRLMVQISDLYQSAKGGQHYFLPVRNGHIKTDVAFESEFENVIKELCEVHNGEIRLKNGAVDVRVVRQSV